MEGDPTQNAQAAESVDAATAPSEESASPSSEATQDTQHAFMNALMHGQGGRGVADPTSKPDGVVPTAELDAARDGESAPDAGGVKPSDQPGQDGKGRRGSAAEIERLAAENARLQATLDEVTPKPADPSEEARQAALAVEQRFRRLVLKPDTDSDWTSDDVDFLISEKQRRAVAPLLEQHYQTVIAEDRRRLQEEQQGHAKGFQEYVLSGMAAIADLPGVDLDTLKAAPDFVARERLIYDAGKSASAIEVKRLQDEVGQLRRELFGATRAPVAAGRAGPTTASFDMNAVMRQVAGRG